jgi:hypothetical protein
MLHAVLLVTPVRTTLEVAEQRPAGTDAKSIHVEVDAIVNARFPAFTPDIIEAEEADVKINVVPDALVMFAVDIVRLVPDIVPVA